MYTLHFAPVYGLTPLPGSVKVCTSVIQSFKKILQFRSTRGNEEDGTRSQYGDEDDTRSHGCEEWGLLCL